MGNDVNNRNRTGNTGNGHPQRPGVSDNRAYYTNKSGAGHCESPSSHIQYSERHMSHYGENSNAGRSRAQQSVPPQKTAGAHSTSSDKFKSLRKKAHKRRHSSKGIEINSTVVLAIVSVAVLGLISIGVLMSHSKTLNAHSGNNTEMEESTKAGREELEQQMNEMFDKYELYSLEIKEVEPEREFPLIRVYNADGTVSLSPVRLADGSIDGTVAYSYDGDGNVITEKKYSKTGRLLYKDVFGGKEDTTARTLYETEFDSKGNYSGYTETLFNSDGVEIGKNKCSVNGVVEGKYDYIYDENGRVSRENRYTPYGDLSVFTEYKYDYLGNVTEKIQFDSTGKEVLRDTMTYDGDGRIVLEQHYTMGVCKSYTEYSYDENGNVIEKSYMLVDEYNMTYKEATK